MLDRGEANAICRVIAKETVTLPGISKMLIPVLIENAEHLGPLEYVDKIQKKETELTSNITRGILDPHQEDIRVQLINFRQEPNTVHAKEHIGVCESYYEMPVVGVCNHIGTEGTSSDKLPSHIEDLFNKSIVHLQEKEKQQLKELLQAYSDVFAKSVDNLGRTNRVQHRINTGTALPIRQASRRLPLGKREIEKREIVKMLDRGVIEPSNSPWSFRKVLIAKKDGSTRVCVDYRALNELIINKDAYPLPRVDDCLDSLARAKWFGCLGLNQGFYQVELYPDDREKTAFSTSQGLFQFTVTPFGLATSPAVFERLMKDVLRGLQWEEYLLYMDDIIVPGATFEEELLRLEHTSLLRTDNAAVSWLQSLKDPTGQVARWLQTLGTYNFKVTHRAGRKHTNADAMSRNPCKSCKRQEDLNQAANVDAREENYHPVECRSNLEKQKETVEHLATPLTEADETPDIKNTEITGLIQGNIRAVTRSELKEQQNEMKDNEALLGGWEPSEIRQQQLEDENIGKVFAAFEAGSQKPPWESLSSGTSALKTLWGQWDRLETHGGVLYRRFETNIGQEARKQMIVPKSRTQELLHYFHDVPSAAHLGVDKILEKLKNGFYWPNMKEYVQAYCRSCDSWFARKPKKESTKAPLGTHVSEEPMERVALDIFGPLSLTKRSNKYILVISDLFTKWTEAIALPNQESSTIYQGRNFQADIFQRMCKLLGIHKTRTTSFSSQSNGGVERFNRTLASMLSMYCKQNQGQWDQYLQEVMMAYRSSVQATTSRTPNSMLFGREVTLPLQAMIPEPDTEIQENRSPDDYVAHLQNKLKENHAFARNALKKVSIYQKKRYDINAKKRYFKRGEAVWIYDPIRKKGVCSKLTPKWKGPFVIEKRIDDVTYRVKRSLRHFSCGSFSTVSREECSIVGKQISKNDGFGGSK
ncbi:Transposon Ty3-I Gag-Pol polyprotein,Transposon Ty3-G Gag-Pol polyprotein [Mytilus coruscus]|uniref:Transposon Ty3-I Gag-Pol polyprotein,Transposon Ty3-G Gag-Pol polyprotein n=1 Tax=Mytilus coruscus TaxID=42192 RepID=A0A6J8EMZ2_MYTCO|nr:Transposon Ty3-I Gag-Pol polyprotein,Transposon Ty3-G Gag-Pol polyprotein [Mytilus coruscus]